MATQTIVETIRLNVSVIVFLVTGVSSCKSKRASQQLEDSQAKKSESVRLQGFINSMVKRQDARLVHKDDTTVTDVSLGDLQEDPFKGIWAKNRGEINCSIIYNPPKL